MKKYAIGIPTLNRLDLLYPAMLYYEIDFPNTKKFIVDNGKQDLGWNLDKVNALIFENEENIGVAASWNKLCKAIFEEHEYAIILNDDIYLGKQEWQIDSFFNWLEISNSDADFFIGPKDWCAFIIPKKTYEEVGDFDERFFPAYYEDNDYATRMKLMGKKVEMIPFLDPAVFRSSETLKKDAGIKSDVTRQKYIEKWGGVPGQELPNAFVVKYERTTIICNENPTSEFLRMPNGEVFKVDLNSIEVFDLEKMKEYLYGCDRLIVFNQETLIDANA